MQRLDMPNVKVNSKKVKQTQADHSCECGRIIPKGSSCHSVLRIDGSKQGRARLSRSWYCGRCAALSWFKRLFGLT